MQTIIAVLGFFVFSWDRLRQHYMSKKKRTQKVVNTAGFLGPFAENTSIVRLNEQDQSHVRLWLLAITDFHEVQCYYSIALLIASYVALYGKNNTNRN